MQSIFDLTKPIGLSKGKTPNPVLNKVLESKNIGSLIDEIGGSSASMGMGQDLPGPGFEEALQEQPGERVSTKASNVDKDVKRDYIKKGKIELANIKPKDSTVKSVKVGTKGLPFLEKNTQAAANTYVKNTINYVKGLGGNEASKIVQGSSFMGATGYGELRNETWSKAKNDPKTLNKFFTEVKGKEAAKAKFKHNGKSYKLNVKVFNPFFEQKTGYTPKGGTKNFVKLVDKEILKKGGKLSGNAGLIKNFILNEAQRLYRLGNKIGAKNILIAFASYIPAIAKAAPLGPIDLFIPSPMGSGELPEEGTPEYEQLMKDMGKNQGGMMDINYMTRPLGYKDGTRDGTTVGDLEKTVKGTLSGADLKRVLSNLPSPVGTVGSMASVTDLLKRVTDTFGQLNEKEREMIKGSESQDPSVTAIDTLRSLAASEVYNSMMSREGVDATKIAGDFLRRQGIPTNDQSMGAIINLLNTQIIPQEQLKLMKEGQSDLEKGMDMGARGIESLLDMLGISDSRKFRDMDRNILKELKDLRTN